MKSKIIAACLIFALIFLVGCQPIGKTNIHSEITENFTEISQENFEETTLEETTLEFYDNEEGNDQEESHYILDTDAHRFHLDTCSELAADHNEDLLEEKGKYLVLSAAEAAEGVYEGSYLPCDICLDNFE